MRGMARLLQVERLRHQAGEPKTGTVELNHLASRIVRQFAGKAEQKNLTLAIDVPATARVNSDPELIRLVLQNLLSNAVKYATRGVVRVQAAQKMSPGNGIRWVLSVSDEGPGIAPDKLHVICDASNAANRASMARGSDSPLPRGPQNF